MAKQPQAELVICGGNDKKSSEQVFGLFPGENVVGLNKKKCQVAVDKQIKLDDQHCMISIEDGEYTIEDLKSQNGTFKVNQSGKQIKLKPNKAYDLGSDNETKTFYLGQYKCLLRKPTENKKNSAKQQNKKKNIKINIHSDTQDNIEEDIDEEYSTVSKKPIKKGEENLQFTKNFKKKVNNSKNNQISSLEQVVNNYYDDEEEQSSKISQKGKGKGKQLSQRAATQEYDDYYDYGQEANQQEIPTIYQESQENQLQFSQKGKKGKKDKEIEKNLKLKEQIDEQWEKNKKQLSKKDEEKISLKKQKNEKLISNLVSKYTGKKKNSQEEVKGKKKSKKVADNINVPLAERLKIIHQSQFQQTQNEVSDDEAGSLMEEEEKNNNSSIKSNSKKGKKKTEPQLKKSSSNESLKGEELIMNLKNKIKKNLKQKKEEQKQADNSKQKKTLKRKQAELSEEEKEYLEDQIKGKKKKGAAKQVTQKQDQGEKKKGKKGKKQEEKKIEEEEVSELDSNIDDSDSEVEEEEEKVSEKVSKKQKLNSGKEKKVEGQKKKQTDKKSGQSKKQVKQNQKSQEKNIAQTINNLKEEKKKSDEKDIVLPKRNLFRVLLSNCTLSDKEIKGMKKLGVHFVNNIKDNFNILIMENFRRRAKVLVAINSGSYVLSKKWVSESIKKNILQLPEKFILKVDKKVQDLYKFDLEKSINLSQNNSDRVFDGQTFQVPADSGIEISNEEVRQIIESGGGKLIQSLKNDSIVLINEKNEDAYKKYVEENYLQQKVYSQEYILNGSLRQEPINPEEFELGVQNKKKGKTGKKQKK